MSVAHAGFFFFKVHINLLNLRVLQPQVLFTVPLAACTRGLTVVLHLGDKYRTGQGNFCNILHNFQTGMRGRVHVCVLYPRAYLWAPRLNTFSVELCAFSFLLAL